MDTESYSSYDNQDNSEVTSGLKTKITKNSRSAFALRDTEDLTPLTYLVKVNTRATSWQDFSQGFLRSCQYRAKILLRHPGSVNAVLQFFIMICLQFCGFSEQQQKNYKQIQLLKTSVSVFQPVLKESKYHNDSDF